MKKKEEIKAFTASGNIFADLGYPNAEETKAKSDLAIQIYQTIKKRNLTQKKAADILGIDQPKISDIIRGKLSKYSIDRLMRYLMILGNDIEIIIKEHKGKTHSTIDVSRESISRHRRIPA